MNNHFKKYDEVAGILYHASSKKFDFPSWDEIDTPKSDACDKRVLGLWSADKPLTGFGDYCYQIEIKDNARLRSLDLSHLIKFHKSLQNNLNTGNTIGDYQELRKLWQSQADVIYLRDAMPGVGEVIILNFDVIKSFSLYIEPKSKPEIFKMR